MKRILFVSLLMALPSVFAQAQTTTRLGAANDLMKTKTFTTAKNKFEHLKSDQSTQIINSIKDLKGLSKLVRGSEGVGGGDLCEDRIKEVRDDVKAWIERGGANGLRLPENLSTDQYSQQMLIQIGRAKVKCVGKGDSGYPVEVNGTPKVCRFDKKNDLSQITCDFDKFQKMMESDQYILIHHEYAGLAGIERPDDDSSNYEISNQITEYLEDQVVKRLAIKPRRTSSIDERRSLSYLPSGTIISLGVNLNVLPTQESFGWPQMQLGSDKVLRCVFYVSPLGETRTFNGQLNLKTASTPDSYAGVFKVGFSESTLNKSPLGFWDEIVAMECWKQSTDGTNSYETTIEEFRRYIIEVIGGGVKYPQPREL